MRKCRVHKLQKTQTILSGSSEDADLTLEDELRALSTEKKEQLLHDAGITVNRPPMITHCMTTTLLSLIQYSNLWELLLGVAARAAEMRKYEENGTELGWSVSPLLLNLTVHVGVETCNAFCFLAKREAIITNSPKSEVLCNLLGKLSFILIQFNARAILASFVSEVGVTAGGSQGSRNEEREAIITNSPKSEVLCNLLGKLSFILIQFNARAILARSGLVLDQEIDPE
eukprot:Em0001g1253a